MICDQRKSSASWRISVICILYIKAMKIWTFLLFLIFPILSQSQVTVKGLVTEQNSRNKPIPGVQIKALGTTPEVTGNDGLFELAFTGKKPGDRIIVSEIIKKGFEVVNKDLVNNWVITNNPNQRTKIVMCPEGLIAQNTLKYYNISVASLTQGYQEKISALKHQKEKAEIDARTFEEQAGLLAEQFSNQQNQLEELAEMFARENFDDCSAIHSQAFEAFKTGNLREAIRILESVNSKEEISRAKEEKRKWKEIEYNARMVQSQSDSIIQQNIDKLIFQARLYESEFRFAEAEEAYETAVLADTTNSYNMYKLATFLRQQNKLDKCIRWAKAALAAAQTNYDRFLSIMTVARWQLETEQYNEAIANYTEAISIIRALLAENPRMDWGHLSNALNNQAICYKEINEHQKAETNYNEVVKILTALSDGNPTYTINLAMTLHNIGVYYDTEKDYEKAGAYLNEALDLYGKVTSGIDSTLLRVWISRTLSSLGYLNFHLVQYPAAEAYFIESLGIIKECVQLNPDAYTYDLYHTQLRLASLRSTMKLYSKSESTYEETLLTVRKLADLNPAYYNKELSKTLLLIGKLYSELNQPEKSHDYFSDALSLARESAREYEKDYVPLLAHILTETAWIQYKINLPQALAYTREAALIYGQLVDSGQVVLQKEKALCFARMTRFLLLSEQFQEAEGYALMSVSTDSLDVSNFKNLAHSLLFQGKYEESKKIYLKIRSVPSPWDSKKTLSDDCLSDLDEFEKAGITHPDVERIRKILVNSE